MTIKSILEEIANEPGTNAKMEILRKYKDNELLKKVLYLAESKRVKFYIKQIPEYTTQKITGDLESALDGGLSRLSNRDLTGHAASEHLKSILETSTPDDAYVIERVISKDLKIGMGGNINKVIPGLIEETPYMGAKSYDKALVEKLIAKGPAFSQIKMDGRYCNGVVVDGKAEMESRAGEKTVLTGAKVLEELSELADEMVFNGELTVIGVPVRRTANGIVASLIDIQSKAEERGPKETQKKIDAFLKKHSSDFGREITFQEALDSVVFTCWDVITLEEYNQAKSNTPYNKRLENLKKFIEDKKPTRINIVETVEVKTVEEAMKHFQGALHKELEGTILKEGKGTWKDGKPNWQVKMKLEMDIDLKIIGFEMGTPGTKNEKWVSTLNLESSCGLLKTNPSGMDEKMMKFVTENQDKLMGKIVEIRCCGLSQDKDGNWSTMHPSVTEIREDKNTCDSLESARAIEDGAKGIVKA
ncbi:MAG: hypothetical protein AABY15_02080 [Nanoarchaeota archaeon]